MITILPRVRTLAWQGLCAVALLITLSACGKPSHPLTVASHPWPGYELMFLARDEGWLQQDAIELVSTRSATESLQLLIDKKVEGATLTLDEVLRARASGIPLTVVLVIDESAGADALYVRPEIQRLTDLPGKRIGVEATAVGAILFTKVLEMAGLSEAIVILVPMSVDQQVESWRQGSLDAVITYEPVATQLSALGARRLFDTRTVPGLIFDVLAIRTEVLDQRGHGDYVRELLRGHFRALDHLRAKPQDAAFRMANRLGLTGDEVLEAFRQIELPGVNRNHRQLAAGGEIGTLAPQLAQILVHRGYLDKLDDLEDLVSDAYLPRPVAR
jgi:NitT/TauT family transport system substrate-binding protein